eukprot:scaffold31611_cov59-Phaeocystis_antarctica.AAC.5
MGAAYHGYLSVLLVLLQHSANSDPQDNNGGTALKGAYQGQKACVQALLRAKADTQLLDKRSFTALLRAEAQGHTAIAELIRQHAAPPQPVAASPAAPPDAGEPEESSPASLPLEIFDSVRHGELQNLAKWLGKGGPICSLQGKEGRTKKDPRPAARRHILQPTGDGKGAAEARRERRLARWLRQHRAHGSCHSANPNLQDIGGTALMSASSKGHDACVKALLRAKANTELHTKGGNTALQRAELKGHTAVAELIRQHAAPPQPAATVEVIQAEQ